MPEELELQPEDRPETHQLLQLRHQTHEAVQRTHGSLVAERELAEIVPVAVSDATPDTTPLLKCTFEMVLVVVVLLAFRLAAATDPEEKVTPEMVLVAVEDPVLTEPVLVVVSDATPLTAAVCS